MFLSFRAFLILLGTFGISFGSEYPEVQLNVKAECQQGESIYSQFLTETKQDIGTKYLTISKIFWEFQKKICRTMGRKASIFAPDRSDW